MTINRLGTGRSLAAAFALFAAAVSAVAYSPSLETRLQTRMDEWHNSGKFAGATASVCYSGGECISLATGFSERKLKTPMKPDSVMLAGSVGKTYVAAVALQLIEKGKFSLDDKISKYLGEEEWFDRLPNAGEIRIRNLMNHTSGLVRYEFNPNFLKDLTAQPEKYWEPEELIAYLFDTEAAFKPGEGWDYSDTNYIVLGMIIEKVTGKTYYDLAVSGVLKPLDLSSTVPQDGPEIKGLVQGYAGEGNPFGGADEMVRDGKFVINPQFEWTGGGMATTTTDLARWAIAMYEAKAFSKASLEEMLKGVESPMLGPGSKYGLGVIIRNTPHGPVYGHSGFFPGYMTEMAYFPEKKFSVAIQVNSSVPRDLGKPLGRVLMEIAGEVVAEKEKEAGSDAKTKAAGEAH